MSGAKLFRLTAAGLVVLAVAGCGKKPGFVEPPQGRTDDRFPNVYPNPALDPKPQPQPQARPGTP